MSERRKLLPLFVSLSSVIQNKEATFHGIGEDFVVKAPGRLIRQLIGLCDGIRTIDEVVSLLEGEWDRISVRRLIDELQNSGVITDCRSISSIMWKAVENPSCFPSIVTPREVDHLVDLAKRRHQKRPPKKICQASSSPLHDLLERRRSVRSFSGMEFSFQIVIDILWAGYGRMNNGRRTTPSAGALYPLMIHLALFHQTGEFSPGVYKVYLGRKKSVGLKLVSSDVNRFTRSFLDPLVFGSATGVVVISGSFKVVEQKYGNRSMLYVPLEAGHVAQNIHLAAVSAGAATLEVGGFVEELLAETVSLPDDYHPLTTIVFGYESCDFSPKKVASTEVDWAIPAVGELHLPFAIAMARVSSDINDDWSYGRDLSPALAMTKAIAEAREWAACGCVPNLLRGCLRDISDAVDPRDIISFHPAQYRFRGFPFERFRPDQQYEWTRGVDQMTGSSVYVIADHVYFPYDSEILPYAFANSSGVAAHPNLQKAIEGSVLELIERDAFMIAYLAGLVLPTVIKRTIPGEIKSRIARLERIGFRVWIKDHSIDLAPVIFVFAQNKELSYTTCASSSGFDIEDALSHSLMEVEASIIARIQNGPAVLKRPEDVVMPLDHGALYEQKRYFRQSDFMVHGPKLDFRAVGGRVSHSWEELISRLSARRLRLITIPLSVSEEYGGNDGLHVVRSIVPGLVPMTFGYRQYPAGMRRIYEVAEGLGGKNIEYRDLPKFPHPFA